MEKDTQLETEKRGLGQHGGGGHPIPLTPPVIGPEKVFHTGWVPLQRKRLSHLRGEAGVLHRTHKAGSGMV